MDRRTTRKPWAFFEHTHKGFCEFLYPVSGLITNTINGIAVNQKPGDLILIREQDTHHLKGSNFTYFNINFDLADLLEFCSSLKIDPYSNVRLRSILVGTNVCHYKVTDEQHINLTHSLNALFEHQQTPLGNMMFQKFLLSIMVDFIIAPTKQSVASNNAPLWLNDLLNHIADNIDLNLVVNDLPEICDRTHEHISRVFKKHLSCTPSQYLNNLRLEKAARLLVHSNQPILDIAYTVGFNNLNYFYKLFSDKYLLTPMKYRKKNTHIT
ncbi:AraC family transcriptional regulator [Poriferisphaera corsica]|uniref:AraC family transcriptional regulator n=1 Tax=Poriferisphaera corsica TaxID=2528020 RepID=UPI00190BA25E|nr:AraC family transcriptional regulator [Poriferisphaera corsica]